MCFYNMLQIFCCLSMVIIDIAVSRVVKIHPIFGAIYLKFQIMTVSYICHLLVCKSVICVMITLELGLVWL